MFLQWVTPAELLASEKRVLAAIAELKALLVSEISMEGKMAIDVSGLVAEVKRETDLVASIKTLIAGQTDQIASLSKQLADALANNDTAAAAAIQQQIDDQVAAMRANDDVLAAAAVANTPAAAAA